MPALRELCEETTPAGHALRYLFQFGSLNKQHQEFFTVLPDDARPEPDNEILRCRWFRARKAATLITSVLTREFVSLVLNEESVDRLRVSVP